MVLDDMRNELAKAQAEVTGAQQDVSAATNRLAVANVHLSNIGELIKPRPLPELMAYLVDNGSYGSTLTVRLKGYIDMLAKSSFRHVGLFQNYQQMVKDQFPQYILDAGLLPTFDTMWSVWRNTTPAQRAEYMTQAEKFNPVSYRFDDAHNQKSTDIKAAVDFMRQFTDKPIFGTFGADDYKLVNGVKTPFSMQAYVDAGLLVSRQFFRQGEPVAVVDGWLRSGRITHGVDLEAFQDGGITTSPADFEAMLAKCLNASINVLTVYAPINERTWLMWQKAPELWQAVQAGAVTVRLWKQ